MEFLLSLEDEKLQQDSFTGYSEDANTQFNQLHQYPAVLGLFKYIREYGTSPCVSTPRKIMVNRKISGNAPIFSSPSLKAHYHLQKGIYCRYIGHKEGAEYNLEKALSLFDEEHHAIGAFRALYQLFGLHCIVDVVKASKDLEQLEARLCQVQDPYVLTLYYQLLGDTLEHKNDWSGAFLAYQKALQLFNNVPNIKVAMHKYPFLKSCEEKLKGAIHWCQAKLPDNDLSHFNEKYLSGSAIHIAIVAHQNQIESLVEHFFQCIGNYRTEDKVYFLLKMLSYWYHAKNTKMIKIYNEKLAFCTLHISFEDFPAPIKALWLECQPNQRKFQEEGVVNRIDNLKKATVMYQDSGLFGDAFRCQLAVMESLFWLKYNREEDFHYSELESIKAAVEKAFPFIEAMDAQIYYHYLMGCYYLENQNFDLALIHFDQIDLKCTPELRHITKPVDFEKTLLRNRHVCLKYLPQMLHSDEPQVTGLNIQRQQDTGEYCLQSDQNPKLELYQFSTYLNRSQLNVANPNQTHLVVGRNAGQCVSSDSDKLWQEFDKKLRLTE